MSSTNNTTLDKLAIRWTDERLATSEIRPRTAKLHRERIRLVATWHHPARVRDLTPTRFRAWWTTTANLSAATRRAYLQTWRGFGRWLAETDRLATNPTDGLALPKVRLGAPRAFTQAQTTAILARAADARSRLIVLLMVQSGLRCMEVAHLAIEAIDWNSGAGAEVETKGGGTRQVPMPAEVLRAARAYLDTIGRPRSGPLIRDTAGVGPLSARYVAQLAKEAIQRAKLPGSAHGLRHTMASHLVDRGVPLPHVQLLLGHARLSTTGIYVRSRWDQAVEAAEGRSYRTAA